MAWEKIYDSNVSFSYDEEFNALMGNIHPFENIPEGRTPLKIRFVIDGELDEELPIMQKTVPNSVIYGEIDENGVPVFSTYSSTVLLIKPTGAEYRILNIALNWGSGDEGAYRVQLYIPEGEPEPTPTPSKKSTTLGVKDAMRHYVSTTEIAEPATTIKKLTKQIMSNWVGEDENIEKARTIAEIYEAAAIKNGYVPEESTSGTSTPIPAVDPSNPDPGEVVVN